MTQKEIDKELMDLKAERSRIERRIAELKNAKHTVGNVTYYVAGGEHTISLRPGPLDNMKKSKILVQQASRVLMISEMENLIDNLTKLKNNIKG